MTSSKQPKWKIGAADGSDVYLLQIVAAIIFILTFIFYIQTRPGPVIDESFLNDPSFTPSRDFVEKLVNGQNGFDSTVLTQNPRHFHFIYDDKGGKN